MKRAFRNQDMIPVRSKEVTTIIRRLFDKAVAIFNESNVDMKLNNEKKGDGYGYFRINK